MFLFLFTEETPLKDNLARVNTERILHGSLARALVSIAVPMVVSSFLQTLYNLTDTFWLGRIGTEPLAAINLVTPLQNVVIAFGGGVTVAGSVLVAQHIGGRRQDAARRVANQMFILSAAFAVVTALLLSLASPLLVAWLGATGETLRHGVTYLRIVILDMPLLFTVNLYQAVRMAQGDSLRPMLLNLLGIGLNTIFDPLLMVGLHMGAAGAALATVAAKAVPAALSLLLLSRASEPMRLDPRLMRPERENVQAIVRIGLPAAIGDSMMQFGFLLMSRNVFAYGVGAMAAYGIGNRINGMITLPSTAMGSAVSTIVAQNAGAGQIDRAERGFFMSMFASTAFLFAGGRVLSLPAVSTAIVRVFNQDAQVVAMAAEFLSTMAFWCWTNGIHDSCCGLFRGMGHTEMSVTVNVCRLWVFRFGTLFFCERALHMGVRSVWYSVVVSNGLSAAILLGLYFTRLWCVPRFRASRYRGPKSAA